jgi:hypothetical protein
MSELNAKYILHYSKFNLFWLLPLRPYAFAPSDRRSLGVGGLSRCAFSREQPGGSMSGSEGFGCIMYLWSGKNIVLSESGL